MTPTSDEEGHVAHLRLARKPVHQAAAALADLVVVEWDAGNSVSPATTMQISDLKAGTGAGHVIPGEMELDFNFGFSTGSTPEHLKARVHPLLDRPGLTYAVAWASCGEPFLTPVGRLSEAPTAASSPGSAPRCWSLAASMPAFTRSMNTRPSTAWNR